MCFVAMFAAMPLLAQQFDFGETMSKFAGDTGFAQMFATPGGWKTLVMLVISCFLLYLAIVKKYEPLLLLPIAFGMLLTLEAMKMENAIQADNAGTVTKILVSNGQSVQSGDPLVEIA